jgi:myo-inositol 2-dehydrogenase/D-chiro-inositol 1-dehydrogenase
MYPVMVGLKERQVVRFALVGIGRAGTLHAECIVGNPDAELVYVCSRSRQTADTFAATYSARVARNIDEVLTDKSIDAILIASSTETHIEYMRAAVRAKKAILCEKPIGLDFAAVESFRNEIAETGAVIQIGFNRRFDPSHAAIHEAVRSGSIGQPEVVIVTSRDPSPESRDYHASSGGIFLDMTIHDFDMVRFILGEDPIEVYATGSVMVDPMFAEIGDLDTAMTVLKTASGALAHINNSRRASYGADRRIEAFGSAGMIQSLNMRPSLQERFNRGNTGLQVPFISDYTIRYREAFDRQLSAFISAVRGGGPLRVTFEDGRRAQILANHALNSLLSGRPEKVDYS